MNKTSESRARFHLKIIAATILAASTIVVSVNAATYMIVSQPKNADIGQMVSGWDRTFKPILYDAAKPDVLALGASWVRDAFDPKLIEAQSNVRLFNMGVSGGTSYEAERFLQSALASHRPQRVLLNINSLGDVAKARQAKFGFNEALLNVDEDNNPNRTVSASRIYAVLFSGAALGYGARVMQSWWQLRTGEPVDEALRSYDRMDFTESRAGLDAIATLHDDGQSVDPVLMPRKRGGFSTRLTRMSNIIDTLCAQGIDAHVYATAHHSLQSQCQPSYAPEMRVYDLLKEKAAMCAANMTWHTFEYPNAITLEGVWSQATESQYYRTDGHPRPTAGSLMLNTILGIEPTVGSSELVSDFGTNLLDLDRDAAEQWLAERKARCDGEWRPGALEQAKRASQNIVLDPQR